MESRLEDGEKLEEISPEWLTLQPPPQLPPLTDVAPVHLSGQGVDGEVELLPVVHPDLSKPGVVPVHDSAGASWEGVGSCLPEHVAHSAARGDQQRPPAHPDPE